MAKVLGITNTNIKGKLGNTVFYTRKGQALARMYQPTVANPKTTLQIRQRTKLGNAVDLNRQIREGLKDLVGTGVGSYEFQGIQKILMNSAIIKQYQTATNGASGSTRAAFLSGLNLKNVLKGVGDNYDSEKLNIFEPGVTIGAFNGSFANGNVNLVPALLLQRKADGGFIWNWFRNAGTDVLDYYFGTDYELGNKLYFISIIPASTISINQALASVNITELDIEPLDINGVTFNGSRVRGVVRHSYTDGEETEDSIKQSIGLCGSDWNFYYKIKGITSNNIYLGSAFNVQGVINGAVQTAVLYNMCYIVATANTNTQLGINVLKGVSYNTYTPHDAVQE